MSKCIFPVDNQQPFYDYNMIAVTSGDLASWFTPGEHNIDPAELISVGGYPAAQYHLLGGGDETDECSIMVGVAEEQTLSVEMSPTNGGFTQQQVCQAGIQAAEMAVATLQTLK